MGKGRAGLAVRGDLDDRFVFYWAGPFSQWSHARFEMDGVAFCTAEQAMMYFKAELFGDTGVAGEILAAEEPGAQKALGRKVRGFDEAVWERHKREIVYRVNLAKFSQNKGLRRKLFQTGARQLVEASPVDVIWGIGLDAETARVTDPSDWPGQNLLGRILTRVRDELKAVFPEEARQIGSEEGSYETP